MLKAKDPIVIGGNAQCASRSERIPTLAFVKLVSRRDSLQHNTEKNRF